ncbi:hypothetical protein FG062_14390 [Vibrio cholerae]|nr:hypothetical protein [Vibrio cholerae]EGR0600803.1 hypothetical protein [Vibrio cholerae]
MKRLLYVLWFTVLTVGIGLTIKALWQVVEGGQNIDIMNLIYIAIIACGLACILILHIKKNSKAYIKNHIKAVCEWLNHAPNGLGVIIGISFLINIILYVLETPNTPPLEQELSKISEQYTKLYMECLSKNDTLVCLNGLSTVTDKDTFEKMKSIIISTESEVR